MKKPKKTTKRRKKIERLLLSAHGPIYEVRVMRGSWARPAGNIRKVSIAAAKQLSRRALDSLYNCQIVAVGAFKVRLTPDHYGRQWMGEIHLVVCGAERGKLLDAFSKGRWHDGIPDGLTVRPMERLNDVLEDVFRSGPAEWDPSSASAGTAKPQKKFRAEYKKWRARLRADALVFRYGADRYFNKLEKEARVRPSKPKKKHPYPKWLEGYMFGGPKWAENDAGSMAYDIQKGRQVFGRGRDTAN